ncbi:LANO_0H10066g1_1 [Lachancea nothofagi CBS 11611]|uniref:Aminopeptidase n=1 Tax=Lachancea nothofagi CBS 11611 TaxID=1266666 RepID=A0A1G4KMD6_9SACH|nr:LANO_0H10066g1_1 [Lachancea nothofagi CBS 11611]
MTSENPDREVLPTNVTPVHYDLSLEPNFETFKFSGSLNIDLKVNDASKDVVQLNTVDIDIHTAEIGGKKALKWDTDSETQVTTFEFAKGLLSDAETATLKLTFTGILNDNMAGFYRAKYTDKKTGETKYMATTQMEPTDARRAFPCFDEPNLKATFDITLISSSHLTHLSNMDVKSECIKDGRKYTAFNTTPKMSTYLVAFIVAELKYVENKDFRIPVRVYATPGEEQHGQFAADLTAKTLAFFERTFGIKYPLPKMDNVAVHEFSAGAMENWGLVTYRVVDLLLDRENSSLGRVQRVAEVVQHELAHQWFGNLVTMDWWEGLWLNEGFATWMSWYSCNEFEPEWKVWEQYVSDTLQSALTLDSLRSSHPIEVPVKRADEINQIFDAISYSKGSSLLRMISQWLGEDVFIKGVSQYLNKFKYGNAKTEDLWDALADASGKDVRKVMDIWTKKVGFPIVSVKEDGNNVTFTQNRYLTTKDVRPEEDQTLFPVFLALKNGKEVDHSLVLNERTKTVTVKDPEFLKVNANQAGIFITSYSDERWAKLGKQADLLSVEDRTGLVADAKALSTSGYTSTTNFLELISGWKTESSFVVWEQMIKSLYSLRATWLFEPKDVNEALNEFTRQLIAAKVEELGWKFETSDSFATQRMKVEMFSTASAAKIPSVVSASLEMFDKYVAGDKNAIPALLKPSVFSTAAKKGGQEYYEKMFGIYQNPVSTDEKLAALRSMGRFEDPKLMERTLGYLFDGTVLVQDIYIPMQGMRMHAAGVKALWVWITENWDELTKRLPPGLSMLGSVVAMGCSGFTSLESIEEVKKFFGSRSTKGFDQGLAQALDTITSKARWIKRDRDQVSRYLKENGFQKNA